MITKPGGITLSEAAALQVPVILYKPVRDKKMKMRCTLKEKELQLSFVMIVRFCKNRGVITRRYEASSNERSDEKHLSSGAS